VFAPVNRKTATHVFGCATAVKELDVSLSGRVLRNSMAGWLFNCGWLAT
jgi:hypothetical protein